MSVKYKTSLFALLFCLVAVLFCSAASAATTEIHIIKYGLDNATVLKEKTVTFQWMEQNLPVCGDGITHYYHQGPVFIDDTSPARQEQIRWNAAEDKNLQEKDMGAVKGTDLRELCNIVGGMTPGDVVKIRASDGFSKTFAYENVYLPSARQGPMVITWYHDAEGYVPAYRTGMRLVFFADNSTNPWGIHAFGNEDWHQSAQSEYWYYYRQGDEKYPTTTGLSVQSISDIMIYSGSATPGDPTRVALTTTIASLTRAEIPLFAIIGALMAGVFLGYRMQKRG